MLKLFGALVILGLALACITSWVLDSYDTTWHPKRSLQHRTGGEGDVSKGSSPPFPGGELNNIFWFIQVGDGASLASFVWTCESFTTGCCPYFSLVVHLTWLCSVVLGSYLWWFTHCTLNDWLKGVTDHTSVLLSGKTMVQQHSKL